MGQEDSAPAAAGGAGGSPPLARFGRENQFRIQAEAILGGEPAGAEPRSRILERNFFGRGKAIPAAPAPSQCFSPTPGRSRAMPENPPRHGAHPAFSSYLLS